MQIFCRYFVGGVHRGLFTVTVRFPHCSFTSTAGFRQAFCSISAVFLQGFSRSLLGSCKVFTYPAGSVRVSAAFLHGSIGDSERSLHSFCTLFLLTPFPPPPQVLFGEGEPSDAIYIIERGSLRLEFRSPSVMSAGQRHLAYQRSQLTNINRAKPPRLA